MTEFGDLLLNGEIRDRRGVVVADVCDSELRLRRACGYDINWDSSAVEIVDDDLLPVLQAWVKEDELYLRYVAYHPGNGVPAMLATDTGVMTGSIERLDAARKKIPRIFEYPGHEYPGKHAPGR